MNCNISSCIYPIILSSLSVFVIFIVLYILGYIFLALDVNWNHSNDLKRQRALILRYIF